VIVIPALDIREGACVQLVGGHYDAERLRIDDPIGVARRFAESGFERLHLVDLDAATERGDNAATLEAILADQREHAAHGAPSLEVQAGGGVRDAARIEALIAAGAARVVVGTRAVEDPGWLAATAKAFPGRLIAACDVRGRMALTHGWERTSAREAGEVIATFAPLPLAGVLVTAVHKEGRLAGTDQSLMADLAARSPHPLIASGGIVTLEDLRSLAAAGIAAAVVGTALYTGALDPRALIEEFD